MVRVLYLTALFLLQGSIICHLVPAFADWLLWELPVGTAPPDWAAAIQLACAGLAVIGFTITLGAPGLVAMRHWQRGAQRFPGLPEWSIAMTFTGAGLFVIGVCARLIEPSLGSPIDSILDRLLPLIPAGTALMCGGVLGAELLRRSIPIRTPRHLDLRIAVDVAPPPPEGMRGTSASPAVILSRAA